MTSSLPQSTESLPETILPPPKMDATQKSQNTAQVLSTPNVKQSQKLTAPPQSLPASWKHESGWQLAPNLDQTQKIGSSPAQSEPGSPAGLRQEAGWQLAPNLDQTQKLGPSPVPSEPPNISSAVLELYKKMDEKGRAGTQPDKPKKKRRAASEIGKRIKGTGVKTGKQLRNSLDVTQKGAEASGQDPGLSQQSRNHSTTESSFTNPMSSSGGTSSGCSGTTTVETDEEDESDDSDKGETSASNTLFGIAPLPQGSHDVDLTQPVDRNERSNNEHVDQAMPSIGLDANIEKRMQKTQYTPSSALPTQQAKTDQPPNYSPTQS